MPADQKANGYNGAKIENQAADEIPVDGREQQIQLFQKQAVHNIHVDQILAVRSERAGGNQVQLHIVIGGKRNLVVPDIKNQNQTANQRDQNVFQFFSDESGNRLVHVFFLMFKIKSNSKHCTIQEKTAQTQTNVHLFLTGRGVFGKLKPPFTGRRG